MKPIRLSAHAARYVHRRGFEVVEVEQAIESESWEKAEFGRLHCHKSFPYGREWNGKKYETKQVRPVFVEEESEIVVITVYTYFF